MKKIISFLCLGLICLASATHAASPAGQRYINMLTQGGPISIREASQGIYHTNESDTEVLDVLAEVVLNNYTESNSSTMIDALSWGCKALAQSGNPRYRQTLEKVKEGAGHRKLAKYAKKSLKSLGKDDAKQYKQGSVNLAKAQKKAQAQQKKQAKAIAKASASGNKQPITIAKKGMSQEEVYALVGQPTATTAHQTGKAWIPFNYKGGDLVRSISLYKGQGRIVFSQSSRYNHTWRVHEVIVNPSETGYP